MKTHFYFLTVFVNAIGLPLNEEQETSSLLKQINPLIIGGKSAGPVPHMVALITELRPKEFICGGSLITNHHVLTAAHCIEFVYEQEIVSFLRGVVGTNEWSRGGNVYSFSYNITHPDYDSEKIKNDIGILVTSSPVKLSEAVQTIALNFDFIPGNVATIVNGWGKYDTTIHKPSQTLMELHPYTLSGRQCKNEIAQMAKKFKYEASDTYIDPELEICARRGKKMVICDGDSGSALLLKERKEQIGIVSWSLFDCTTGAPDVYVRLSAYKSWILESVQL